MARYPNSPRPERRFTVLLSNAEHAALRSIARENKTTMVALLRTAIYKLESERRRKLSKISS